MMATLSGCPPSLAVGDSGYAYGIATAPSGTELQIIATSPMGATATARPFAISTAHETHATFALGRLYTTAGPVYDVRTPAAPVLVGATPLAGGVAVDASTRAALVFGATTVSGSQALVWRLFDADTLNPIFGDGSSYPIGADGFVSELIQTGPNRFAAIVYPNGDSNARRCTCSTCLYRLCRARVAVSMAGESMRRPRRVGSLTLGPTIRPTPRRKYRIARGRSLIRQRATSMPRCPRMPARTRRFRTP